MSKTYINTLVFCLLFIKSYGQIPLTITEFNFNTDTIIGMTYGDPDMNGINDIFLIIDKRNSIYKLENDGLAFTKKTYATAISPQLIQMTKMNGLEILAYSLENKKGVYTFYSNDGYHSEKTAGPIIGEDLVTNAQDIINLVDPAFPFKAKPTIIRDVDNKLHCYSTFASSFYLIAAPYVKSITLDFEAGKMSGIFFPNDKAKMFLTDIDNKRLLAMNISTESFSVEFDENLELIEQLTSKPIATHTLDLTDQKYLYLLDDSPALTRYDLKSANYDKEVLSLNMNHPSQILTGRIDADTLEDLIIVDDNKVYLVSNIAGGRAGLGDPVLIAEETTNIRNLFIYDFNKDGFSDIIYNLVGSSTVKVLRNDIATVATIDQSIVPNLIFPNPVTDLVNIKEGKIQGIYNLEGKLLNARKMDDQSADVSTLVPGIYLVQVSTNDGESVFIKIIKK